MFPSNLLVIVYVIFATLKQPLSGRTNKEAYSIESKDHFDPHLALITK